MPSKIGIHALSNGQAIPLVQQAKARGILFPVVKNVLSPGISIDTKAIEPRTKTITRIINPNPEWEAFNNVQTWDQAKRVRCAQESIQAIFDRTNPAERQATDWFEVTNEASPKTFYREFGLALIELVHEADRHGIKLALPALNAGTPEWSEMQALVSTALFGLMKAGGHILSIHEGVFGSDPVEKGFGDIIPGSPVVAGAGSLCFRYRYLYSLLAPRNEVVPLVVSEFYGGGSYTLSPDQQVARFAWYDHEAQKDSYVLACLPFTIDPTAAWKSQDYTYCYPTVLDYMVKENVLPPPPKPVGTHKVNTASLNVREFPWIGAVTPPVVGLLSMGQVVTVIGTLKGWACISSDGNRWVNGKFLAPI